MEDDVKPRVEKSWNLKKLRGLYIASILSCLWMLLAGCMHNMGASPIDHKYLNTDDLLLITIRYEPVDKLPAAALGKHTYRQQTDYSLSNFTRHRLKQLSHQYNYQEVDRWPVKSLGLVCIIIRPDSKQAKQNLLTLVERDPSIESVEPIRYYSTVSSLQRPATIQNSTPYKFCRYLFPYSKLFKSPEAQRCPRTHHR